MSSRAYPGPMSGLLEEKRGAFLLSQVMSQTFVLWNLVEGFGENCSETRQITTCLRATIVKGKNHISIRNMCF